MLLEEIIKPDSVLCNAHARSKKHCLEILSELLVRSHPGVASEDIVALSKQITAWAKELESLEIKGAAVEGQTLDAAGVEKLSKSPGRPELLSKIAGLILSPAGNIAGALLGTGGTIVGQVKSHSEREE